MWFLFISLLSYAGFTLLHPGFFSSYSEQGYFLVAVPRLLIAVACLVVEHGLQGAQASAGVACGRSSCGPWALEHRLNSCGTQAWLLRGRWDLLGWQREPVSSALSGGFFTTEPPGKPPSIPFWMQQHLFNSCLSIASTVWRRQKHNVWPPCSSGP